MDKITLEKIQLLHPKIRKEVNDAYLFANNNLLGKNLRLRFAHTLRSFTEQDNLYALGRTKLFDNNGNRFGIVTKAKGGESIHNYGLAFDIVLLLDKNNDGTFNAASWDINRDDDHDRKPDWKEVADYFKKLGWKWGGDWRSFLIAHILKRLLATLGNLCQINKRQEIRLVRLLTDRFINGSIYEKVHHINTNWTSTPFSDLPV